MSRVSALVAACGLCTIASAQSFTTIYKTGDVVPGSGGQAFRYAYDSSISNDGHIAFKVRTNVEPNSAVNQGIYFGTLAGVDAIAYEGAAAPGTAYSYEDFNGFDDVGPVRVSAAGGHYAFAAQLAIPGIGDPDNVGIWGNQTGTVQKIGLVGDAAPDNTGTFGGFERPWIDNQGRSIFFAFTSQGSGIYADSNADGVYSKAAFSGDVITGLNSGETLRDFSFAHGNSTGQWLVLASVNGSSNDALVAGDHNTGDVRVVLREGAAISNSTQTVGSFADIGDNQLINANGTLAFGMFGSSFRGGIVVASADKGVRVVGESGQAIGNTGLTFNSNFTATPKLNNLDEVSFVGRISGASSSTDRAIFVTDSDLNASIFLREGDEVNGLSGVFFDQPFNSSSGPDHLFNDSGIVIAGIDLDGAVNSSNDYAVVWGTSSEDLAVLLRTGDSFDLGTESKIISGITYSDELGADGLPISFNSNNEFIFQLTFTDGTAGIFTTTIPAPASLGLLIPGMLAGARRRRA